jgi:hypothetical protein
VVRQDSPPLLDEDNAAFVQGGVSIVAASRDADLVPSTGRIAGCRVSADRRRVSVFVAATQAPALLADVRACRRIAVVFTRPTTHRTLQLKADDAVVRPATADEMELLPRHIEAFAIEIAALGYSGAQARALLACSEGDVQAIDFTPSAAFEQTPGPKAGTPLATP